MTSIAQYLTRDHDHCDDLFAEAENAVAKKDWSNAPGLFSEFQQATLAHFTREEAILFPDFEARTGMTGGPTMVMRDEHLRMRQTLDAMADAVRRRDDAAYLGLSETLLMLMRQHNLKEEQILYPMSDQALAELAEDLVARMDAVR